MFGGKESLSLQQSSFSEKPQLPSSSSSSSRISSSVEMERKDSSASLSSFIHCILVLLALAGIVLTVLDFKSQIPMHGETSGGEDVRRQDTSAFLMQRDRYSSSSSSSSRGSSSSSSSSSSGGTSLSGGDSSSSSSSSSIESEVRRKLSLKIDPITGASVQTYNGDVPETPCPLGKYRLPGSTDLQMIRGQRTDGCIYCPRGRYGSSTSLSNRQCTAPCPMGRYGDRIGATSVYECSYCPTGKFGATQGLTTPKCSGTCAAGKYSGEIGLTRAAQCMDCPVGYRGWQCASWDNIPLKDSQLARLNNGQQVSNPDRILE